MSTGHDKRKARMLAAAKRANGPGTPAGAPPGRTMEGLGARHRVTAMDPASPANACRP
ncbi:MAG TPA: hypothetical protein VGH27_07835 [Streptosporangiaceae bacterium]|jgi:hypothetical protein